MLTLNGKKFAILVVLLLVVGVVITVIVSRQQTQTKQSASEIVNINKADSLTNTNNSDGTMGPQTSAGNFSNSLAESNTGSLIFMVTDPIQVTNKPSLPTRIPPADAQKNQEISPSSANPTSNGPQSVSSLVLKIKKVEVHMAYLDDKSGQKAADHWETLNIALPISVDLVQLAKGGVASLGLTKLAAGQYTEVRLYVLDASAILSNGTNVNLDILGKDNIVRVVQPFSITTGKNTTLVMDFDAGQSVVYNGGKYLLKPVVSRLLENK